MFRRFVSGSAIASIVIALAVIVMLLTPPAIQERVREVTVVWCLVPAAWGLWAMIAPAGWVPQRFPLWGAGLGLMAGVLVAFVLNLPSRIAGVSLPVMVRGAGVVGAGVFYYFLWMLVRFTYRSLGTPAPRA